MAANYKAAPNKKPGENATLPQLTKEIATASKISTSDADAVSGVFSEVEFITPSGENH